MKIYFWTFLTIKIGFGLNLAKITKKKNHFDIRKTIFLNHLVDKY